MKVRNFKFSGSCCCKFLRYVLITYFEKEFCLSKHFEQLTQNFKLFRSAFSRMALHRIMMICTPRGALAVEVFQLCMTEYFFNYLGYFFMIYKTDLKTNIINIYNIFQILTLKFNLMSCFQLDNFVLITLDFLFQYSRDVGNVF